MSDLLPEAQAEPRRPELRLILGPVGQVPSSPAATVDVPALVGALPAETELVIEISQGRLVVRPGPQTSASQIRNMHVVTLNEVSSLHVLLKRSIQVNVEERAEDDFIACFYEAEVYGYGSSIAEALEDLGSQLVDQFEDLSSEEKDLGPLPARQLVVLGKFMEFAGADVR